MKISCPSYYNQFQCIAAQCPDSCCKEWEIDLDPDTAQRYLQLSGDLGDRLRQVLRQTEEGVCMTIEDGRCPMWRQDGLCRIQAELGHDALCQTCRDFPRLQHDYGTFAEWGLELSCPEAARLILSWDGTMVEAEQPGDTQPDYEETDMTFLLESRKITLDYLNSTQDPPSLILAKVLTYGEALQNQWDGGDPARFPADFDFSHDPISPAPLFAFFSGLEILTEDWQALLSAPPRMTGLPQQAKALLHYFIGRHWLQAISDFDLLGRVCFFVAACILIGSVNAPIHRAAQLFSKEIENNTENLYRILDGTYTEPALSTKTLLAFLP